MVKDIQGIPRIEFDNFIQAVDMMMSNRTRSKKELPEFKEYMWQKLKEGEKKYGTKYESANVAKELLAECVDACNYIFMLFLKIKGSDRLTKYILKDASKLAINAFNLYIRAKKYQNKYL